MAVILGLAQANGARANGATVEVVRTNIGPYEIMVGALPNPPKAGFVHLTVTVTDLATSLPVTDASVRVFVRRQGDERRGQAVLLNSPAAPGYYDANVNLPRSGLWQFSIEVSADQGQETIDLSFSVESQAQTLSGRLTWSVMTAVIVLGAVYVWWTARKARRRRSARV